MIAPRQMVIAATTALVIACGGGAGAIAVAVLSTGVMATTAPAWTMQVEVFGWPLRLNVPGLIRLATAPGVAHLLAGQTLQTPAGRIAFDRDGNASIVSCAPCRVQHPALARTPLVFDRVEIRAERAGARVHGRLVADGLHIDYEAQLATDRIRLDWTLPPTEVAKVVRALATIVPEAHFARVEGELAAQGRLELPAGRSSAAFRVNGLEVGGLGTEALQSGPFAVRCRDAGGVVRRQISGDSAARWVTLDKMGAYLPAALIAAEDQRFHDHAGYDADELSALLAEFDPQQPQRGASTLTQQLARTLFLDGDKTAARKLRELLYAVEMERTLGKARILELYLNIVDWGPGLCGARAAARGYFGKPPAALTPIEAAWLAGILRNPHSAHAAQFAVGAPERERAEWVLQQMREFPRRDRLRWARASLEFVARKPRPAQPA